jgi:hypothetical protein
MVETKSVSEYLQLLNGRLLLAPAAQAPNEPRDDVGVLREHRVVGCGNGDALGQRGPLFSAQVRVVGGAAGEVFGVGLDGLLKDLCPALNTNHIRLAGGDCKPIANVEF